MLLAAARANGAAHGRSYCIPDDVKVLAPHVLSHRIIASPNGSGGDTGSVVRDVLRSVPVNEAV